MAIHCYNVVFTKYWPSLTVIILKPRSFEPVLFKFWIIWPVSGRVNFSILDDFSVPGFQHNTEEEIAEVVKGVETPVEEEKEVTAKGISLAAGLDASDDYLRLIDSYEPLFGEFYPTLKVMRIKVIKKQQEYRVQHKILIYFSNQSHLQPPRRRAHCRSFLRHLPPPLCHPLGQSAFTSPLTLKTLPYKSPERHQTCLKKYNVITMIA